MHEVASCCMWAGVLRRGSEGVSFYTYRTMAVFVFGLHVWGAVCSHVHHYLRDLYKSCKNNTDFRNPGGFEGGRACDSCRLASSEAVSSWLRSPHCYGGPGGLAALCFECGGFFFFCCFKRTWLTARLGHSCLIYRSIVIVLSTRLMQVFGPPRQSPLRCSHPTNHTR